MLRFACHTDPGRMHSDNQDRWFADAEHGIFLVTDGMANDIAPRVVIDKLPALLEELLAGNADWREPSWQAELQAALLQVHADVYDEMAVHGELGLGTTLVLALVREQQALLAHIGDSRMYLYRQDKLQPITRDHSLIERLVDRGAITAEDAAKARGNGGPTRFLGQSDDVEAELQWLDLQVGDRLLLCSDGLNTMLGDEEIEAVFARQEDLEITCEHLVADANEAGGADNTTVLIVEV